MSSTSLSQYDDADEQSKADAIVEIAKQLEPFQQAILLISMYLIVAERHPLNDDDLDTVISTIRFAYHHDPERFEDCMGEAFEIIEEMKEKKRKQSGGYYVPMNYWQLAHMPMLMGGGMVHLR